jgi:hypothetical protein
VTSSNKKLAIGSSKQVKRGILSKKQKCQIKPASTNFEAHGSPLLSAANNLPDGRKNGKGQTLESLGSKAFSHRSRVSFMEISEINKFPVPAHNDLSNMF